MRSVINGFRNRGLQLTPSGAPPNRITWLIFFCRDTSIASYCYSSPKDCLDQRSYSRFIEKMEDQAAGNTVLIPTEKPYKGMASIAPPWHHLDFDFGRRERKKQRVSNLAALRWVGFNPHNSSAKPCWLGSSWS